MSSSLILTNCLFCSIAALIVVPLLKHPNTLTYKKGIPIFFVIILVFAKMLIPYEFTFTHTLASKSILPAVKNIENIYLLTGTTIGTLFKFIWLFNTFLMLIYIILKHQKLLKVLSLVPSSKNKELNCLFTKLCIQKGITNKTRLVELELESGPFIIGFLRPIIVLPFGVSIDEAKCILLHEIEHLKHYHVLIRACTEIITAIYWWNPIVWLLRREIIKALELQADVNVIKSLSYDSSETNKPVISYLETLIKVSRIVYCKQNNHIALSFAMNNSLIQYRIQTVLKFNNYRANKKTLVSHFGLLLLSTVILFFSFIYTFESYNISPTKIEGTFTADPQTDYFKLRGQAFYDLYIDGRYVYTLHSMPEELSNLPLHE